MNLLGIETAIDTCGVAVMTDGELRAVVHVHRPRVHAERLVPLIQSLLREAALAHTDLDAVAVSAGPGSFTGLRIGVSTAKGLCEATGALFIPVPTLEAFAFAHARERSPGEVLVPAFTSRRNEVYAAAYQVQDDGTLEELLPARGERADAFASAAAPYADRSWLIGPGAARLHAHLSGVPEWRVAPSVRPDAAAIAQLGDALGAAGAVSAANYEPAYVKEVGARRPARTALEKLAL